jgi:hypothetical protein
MVTIGFVGLVLYVGKRIFSVRDWGRYEPCRKDAPSGIVYGKYLPPVFLKGRPINKVDMQAYRAFHTRHDVVGERKFLDMIERS